MNCGRFRDNQGNLFFNARAVYLDGEAPVVVDKVKEAVGKELVKAKPFEMDEWKDLMKDVEDHLGIKDLNGDVKNKATEIVSAKINSKPQIKDAAMLINLTFLELKSYLQFLKTKVFALKAKAVASKELGSRNRRVAGEVVAGVKETAKGVKKIGLAEEGAAGAAVLSGGGKGVEAAGELEKVMELIKKGVISAEDAYKMGLKIETVKIVPGLLAKLGIGLKTAERLTKVVHVAGRFAIVADAAISVYDVYDQAQKLGQALSSDYEGSVVGAAASIVDHTPDMELTRGAKREAADRERLAEPNLAKKLVNARNMANELVNDASGFGVKGVDKSTKGFFAKVESAAETVLGAPTEYLAGAILGSPEANRLQAEKKTIEGAIGNANTMLAQLSAVPRTEEIEKTGSALMAAINLAQKAIKEGKPANQGEASAVKGMINAAKPSPKPPVVSA